MPFPDARHALTVASTLGRMARPLARLRWIRAHDGSRWNEYADSLATAYLRDEV